MAVLPQRCMEPHCNSDVAVGSLFCPTHRGDFRQQVKETAEKVEDTGTIRQFETGATRDSAVGKQDPEGYLSALVIERYCEFMQKHQYQSDGTLRASDNWQKGMPFDQYVKAGWRHFKNWWKWHRGYAIFQIVAGKKQPEDIEDALCALIFNASGFLHELLKRRGYLMPGQKGEGQ